MRRRVSLAPAAASLLVATASFAEPAREPDASPGAVAVEAQAHFGVSTTPFDVRGLSEARGQAFAFMAGGRYVLTEPLSLALRVPFVLGSVAQPAGSFVDAAALGNPALEARYRLLERRTQGSLLVLSQAVELGLPLATHADDLMPNRVLAIADGIEGRGCPEWFTPGVVPITPSAVFGMTLGRWSVEGKLRLPLLVRVSDASLPSRAANTHPFGLAAVFGAEGRYRVSRRLSLAAATQLFFDVAPAVEHADGVSRLQDFERLSLLVHFGPAAVMAVDVQTAIGGELGGTTVAGGLRAAVTLE